MLDTGIAGYATMGHATGQQKHRQKNEQFRTKRVWHRRNNTRKTTKEGYLYQLQ